MKFNHSVSMLLVSLPLVMLGCGRQDLPLPTIDVREEVYPTLPLNRLDDRGLEWSAFLAVDQDIEYSKDATIFADQYNLEIVETPDAPIAIGFRIVEQAGEVLVVVLPGDLLQVTERDYVIAALINLDDTPSGIGADQARVYSLDGSVRQDAAVVDLILRDATEAQFQHLVFDDTSLQYRPN